VIHARESGSGSRKIELSTGIEATSPAGTAGPYVSLCVRTTADTRNDAAAVDETELRPWLGMATTQAILAQYGGMMTAALDLPDTGTVRAVRYVLYLPLASGTDPSRIHSDTASPLPPAVEAATILLVEEEPLIRELSRDMLERQGFRVLTAGNATEAERIASGQEIQVLITDWTSGGMLRVAWWRQYERRVLRQRYSSWRAMRMARRTRWRYRKAAPYCRSLFRETRWAERFADC
jgi:hypothetical protein